VTTIAIDRFGTIAADGLTLCGDERIATDSKKITVREAVAPTPDGSPGRPARLYALSGERAMTPYLIEWYEAGHDPRNAPPLGKDSGYTFVVVEPAGDGWAVCFMSSDSPYPMRVEPPFACGAGDQYAIGLLTAGHTAREAVEVACKLSIKSGGEIQVVDIAEAFGLKPADKMQAAFEVLKARQETAE
jgi:hypothetical protein